MSQVFSGSPDVAYCSGIPVTHPPVTLAAWVKPSNPPTSGRQTVLSVGYDAGTGLAGNGYGFGLTSSGKWGLFVTSGASVTSGGDVASTVSALSGVWTHVAATFDASGAGKLYVSGSLVLSNSFGFVNSGSSCLARGAQAHGNSPASGFWRYFKGEISEAGVWNTALSSGEVSTAAGNGSGVGYDKAYTVNQAGIKYYKNLACDSSDYYVSWPSDVANGSTWNIFTPFPDAPGGSPLPCSSSGPDWDNNYGPGNYGTVWPNWPSVPPVPGPPPCTQPAPMYVAVTDKNSTGACAVAKTKMPWIKGQGTWNCSVTLNTCSPPFALFLSYNEGSQTFNLVVKNSTTGAQLESIAAVAPNCAASPWGVTFIPTGTWYAGCTCDQIPHFNVTKT